MDKKEAPKREVNVRTKAVTMGKHNHDDEVKIGGEWKFSKNPAFLKERVDYWDSLYKKQEAVYADFPHDAITITLPDGKVKEGKSFETSPFDIAKGISSQFAKTIVVAKVKYEKRVATLDEGLLNPEAEEGVSEDDQWFYWDVNRPLEGSCEMSLFKFEDKEGRETFWHSSAHVLGETLEQEYGVHLCVGPPTEEGFFYDSYTGKDIFAEKDYKSIEKAAMKVVASKQTFQRLVLTKSEALELFKNNIFKVSMITNKIPDGSRVTAYKCGTLIDLCTGPHIPATTMIKAFRIEKNSSSYWLGKAGNDSLQRVYGITFPDKKMMEEHIHFQEEAKKRDHRHIGQQQDLFHINTMSPGCAFFYAKGTLIYNGLMNMIRNEYRVRGFNEVISPNIFNLHLWKTSGHYINYKDNIFMVKVEDHGFGVKPMNCPGHCLMFKQELRSYRDLPLRLADFGVLHRNEISGALSGLTRVRRFQQDDAHIFCMLEQVEYEVTQSLDFLEHIYGIFGFTFELELSTRPKDRLGSDDTWDKAEKALENALNTFGKPWKINAGDGAFYGPKIDIKVFDALKRHHQCGTVQLDFQLPIRFGLEYKTDQTCEAAPEDKEVVLQQQVFPPDENDGCSFTWKEEQLKPGFARPVIVHRAILGSVERFMAILIEHLGGKWPFFMSPRQVLICPVTKKYQPYCEKVYQYLHQKGYHCEFDTSQKQLPNRIRLGKEAQWNYIVVAGEKEELNGTVDVNPRDPGDELKGQFRLDHVHQKFQGLYPKPSGAYERFYSNMWKASDYGFEEAAAGGQASQGAAGAGAGGAKFKLTVEHKYQTMGQMIQVCGDIAGWGHDVAISADKSISPSGRLPVVDLYDENNTRLFETEAVLQHIARANPGSKLGGSSAFEAATINQWISWCQRLWIPKMHGPLMPVLGFGPPDQKRFTEGLKECKALAKILDTYLNGKTWIAGNDLTIADLYLGSSFMLAFQTVFDGGFRKAHKHITKWFQSFIDHPAVQKRFGKVKMTERPLMPPGCGAGAKGGDAAPAAKPAKGGKKETKKADDDDLDLFGDDDEEDLAAAKKAAEAAKAGKKKKEKPPEMSLIVLEVKPLDDTTDLDKLAKDKIFKINKDGLIWKSGDYKKVPVAFGIFKLILGFSCEDSKVSVDQVVEDIEAFDDLVQSVEIASFTKI